METTDNISDLHDLEYQDDLSQSDKISRTTQIHINILRLTLIITEGSRFRETLQPKMPLPLARSTNEAILKWHEMDMLFSSLSGPQHAVLAREAFQRNLPTHCEYNMLNCKK